MERLETDAERPARHRPRRRVILAVLALVLVGLVAVSAYAAIGHTTGPVVTMIAAARHPTDTTAHRSLATTTPNHPTRPTTKPASTTTETVATTVPLTTTPPPTSPYVPTPTVPTTPPPTTPPTSDAPKTASLRLNPSPANFPSTPPPYWPMPIVTVTITNTGGVTIRSIAVHPVGVYSVPSSTCTTLMPGQNCHADVQFCPTTPGHYLNTLLVTGNDADTGIPLQTTTALNGTAT